MFCPNCGKEIPDDSSFCEFCGSRIEDDDHNGEQTGSDAKSSFKNPALIGIAVFLVMLLIGGIYFVRAGKESADRSEEAYDVAGSGMGGEAGEAAVDSGMGEEGNKEETAAADSPAGAVENPEDAQKSASDEKSADATGLKEGDSTGTQDSTGNVSSDAGQDDVRAPEAPASLESFDWYFDEGVPTGGEKLTTLKEVCGEWNCMVKATMDVDEGKRTRLLITDARIVGSESELRIEMNLKEQVEYMESTPNTKTITKPENETLLIYDGSWMEPMGYISVKSRGTELNFQLKEFFEADGKQYAIGSSYNGDVEFGEIVMVR